MTAPYDDDNHGDDATTASLDSAEHDVIDISKAPAVVSWAGEDSQVRSLSHSPLNHNYVTLDIQFDAGAHTAFFKITANIGFAGKRNKSNAFLFVYPERVQSLAVVDDEGDGSVLVPKRLGTSTYSLHFTLATPSALVVPKDGLAPKDDVARSTLESLQALAVKTSFQVEFPCETLAKDRLVALCDEASCSGCLRTMPGTGNLARLYGGKGGRVVVGSTLLVPACPYPEEMSGAAARTATQAPHDRRQGDTQEFEADLHEKVESPPSYDESGRGHSPPSPSPPANKRRRLTSKDAAGDASQVQTRLEDICRQGFGDIGRRLDRIEQCLDGLGSRLDRVERRIRIGIDQAEGQPHREQHSSEQDDRQRDGLGKRIDCVEERVASVEAKLETGLIELADSIEYQMADAKNELEHHVLVCVEDEMGTAQSQFEDFVRDEVRNVGDDIEGTVRERLIDALSC